MNQLGGDICKRLEWDSGFFGIGIARLMPDRLSPAIVDNADRWCREQNLDCLYFLSDAKDRESIRLAEEWGFNCVDIRMTMTNRLTPDGGSMRMPTDSRVRPAKASDLEFLRSIASHSYQDSRFYFDGRFDIDKCDRLYEIWLENSFANESGVVLVADSGGRPSGYVTCEISASGSGHIGLLGVGASAQGAGLGSALVHSANSWFASQGLNRAEVVTQGRNIAAQVVYQRSGYVSSEVQLWFHRWFDY